MFSTVRGYHDARGDIMSTVEGVQYREGKNPLLFEYPMVLNTPHGTHDIPHMYHDIPHSTQISKDGIPQVLNTPTVLMIFPTVLNTPHGTQDILITPRYSRYQDIYIYGT